MHASSLLESRFANQTADTGGVDFADFELVVGLGAANIARENIVIARTDLERAYSTQNIFLNNYLIEFW